MSQSNKKVIFISESLPLGGTSAFALNICAGMQETGGWQGVAAGLRGLGEMGQQILSSGYECLVPVENAVLHEERIESLYAQCARIAPRAVVAALSGGSFDFLRVVPDGCVRIGMIQSDDGCVYDLVERYLPWIDAIAGVSSEICRKMTERLNGQTIPVFHQPYGVPLADQKQRPTVSGPLRVLYLGRIIEEQKRISMMVKIMRETLKADVAIQWTIAGDGQDLGFLKECFAGENRVSFLGSLPYSQVPAVLATHDVYFLCSDYEGLPLSLLEAMGAGLVPVVSDLPSGISEVVNDSNGIRLPIHNTQGYVDALIDLASNPGRLTALSEQAPIKVRENHSTVAMARRWEEMLDSISPEAAPVWAESCHAIPPLGHEGYLKYLPLFRPVRSFLKRMMR